MMQTTARERKYANANRLMTLLEDAGYPTRLVGGCVRDRYLHVEPNDFDLATTALPSQVMEVCKAARCKVIPTGLDHGTVTVIMQSHTFEVTTLRQDIATDGRHAEVQFGTSFEEDAARRDFTMNAMSEDRHGVVYDYFEGKAHLEAKILVFVGDPTTRIKEDYLRILRFFRFKARFALKEDRATLAAISQLRGGLQGISRERITSEMWGLFACQNMGESFTTMLSCGIWGEVFPALTKLEKLSASAWQAMHTQLDALQRQFRPHGRLVMGLFVGYPWPRESLNTAIVGAIASDLTENLRLAKVDRSRIQFALIGFQQLPKISEDIAEVFGFIDSCEAAGGEGILTQLYEPLWKIMANHQEFGQEKAINVKLQGIVNFEKTYGHRRRMPLPVSGKEVMDWAALGGGPLVGEILTHLKAQFRRGLWQDKNEAKRLVHEFVAGLPK